MQDNPCSHDIDRTGGIEIPFVARLVALQILNAKTKLKTIQLGIQGIATPYNNKSGCCHEKK
jgi:hypothetical protein